MLLLAFSLKSYKWEDGWIGLGYKGKPHRKCDSDYLGIARKGEGVSTLARMVWGNFFGKNLLDFGGSRPLPGWFGALFSEMKCPRVPG